MITDTDKIIIDRKRQIDIYSDSFDLADKLRTMAELSEGEELYYLNECADHIEGMYKALRSSIYSQVVKGDNHA